MTALSTSAELGVGTGGAMRIESYVRPVAATYVDCYVYDDSPPILVIREGAVSVTVTVPDQDQVTEHDVAWGRSLAEAAARYAVALEQRAANQDAAGADEAA
jgi:hypothetical protein